MTIQEVAAVPASRVNSAYCGAVHDLASRVTFEGAPAFNLDGTSVVSVAKVTEPGKYLATSQGTNAAIAVPVASDPLPEIAYKPTAAYTEGGGKPVTSVVTDATIAFDGFNEISASEKVNK